MIANSDSILLFLEWFGAISALLGSFALASRKFNPSITWYLWIISNICYIIYFFSYEQYGLLLLNIFGLLINLFGLYQWAQSEYNINQKITKNFLNLSVVFSLVAFYCIVLFIFNPKIIYAEWIGSMLGIAAALLISSRHKYSFLCWPMWILSNGILLTLTIMTEQYGVVFLQSGFMLINVYGFYNWFKNINFAQKINQIEILS